MDIDHEVMKKGFGEVFQKPHRFVERLSRALQRPRDPVLFRLKYTIKRKRGYINKCNQSFTKTYGAHIMQEKFRLLIFIHTNLALGAGEEKAILNYSRYCPKETVNLTVVQTDYSPYRNLSDTDIKSYAQGVNLLTIYSPESLFRFEEIYNSRSNNKVVRMLARFGFIVVKLFLASPYSFFRNRNILSNVGEVDAILYYDLEFVKLLPSVKSRVRIGTLRRNFNPKARFFNAALRPIYRYLARKVDALHFLNKNLMDNSIIHRKFDFVQESGVDTFQFKPVSVPDNNLKFLFVSRLESIKGTEIVIDAFRTLKDLKVDLYVVGSGSLADRVRKASETDSRIHYLGYKSGKELADVYRMCDVFVFPTLQPEQHPLVIKEALASGMFVICSSTLRGIFDDFEAKSFLEYISPDIESVSHAMRSAFASVNTLRSQRFQIARSAEIYDWKNIAEHLFQKIMTVTENKFRS